MNASARPPRASNEVGRFAGSVRTKVPAILLLYQNPLGAGAPTIMEHVNAYSRYSRFPVCSVNTQLGFPGELNTLEFSAIVLHYSLFGRYPFLISNPFQRFLEASPSSFKIAFFQDENQHCPQRFAFIDRAQIDAIYSLLEPAEWEKVYLANTRCKNVHHTLTGYVDDELVTLADRMLVPDDERPIDIGYRGRPLPYYMGEGALEKTRIAEGFTSRLASSTLRLDIKTGENDRIYGDAWHFFVANCKAMLGAEAGVSVFDLSGSVKAACDRIVAERPGTPFAELQQQVLLPWENNIYYRTISPRIFEAAAFRVCMINFEGRYNDILEPMRHYIPLRKDFSNFEWVMQVYANPQERKRLTDQAYSDLIQSGKYSYRSFIRSFDRQLEAYGLQFDADAPAARRAMELLERDQARRVAAAGARLKYSRALRRAIRSIPGSVALNAHLSPVKRWLHNRQWAKF